MTRSRPRASSPRGVRNPDSFLDSAVAKYEQKQGQSGTQPFVPRKLVAHTTVLQVAVSATTTQQITTGERTDPSSIRVDTCAEAHVFNDRKYFPEGVDTSRSVELMTIAHGNGGTGPKPIPCQGVGDAIVIDEAGHEMRFTGAILCESSRVNLLSDGELRKKGVEIYYNIRRPSEMRWPDGTITYFGDGGSKYQTMMDIRPVRLAVDDVITRGKAEGNKKLGMSATAALWQRRTGLGAQKLRELPDTTDAPQRLKKVKDEDATDHARLRANMPKLPTPPVTNRLFGKTVLIDICDLITKSKHGGNKYCINFVVIDADGNTQEHPDFMQYKSEYPRALEDFLNSGAYGDYQLYCDNEIVLCSGRVKDILRRRHMKTLRNSCEYEPWQQGKVERTFRTYEAAHREFAARAFADVEEGKTYIPYCINQRADVRNAQNDPNENGHITHLRVPFCLAYVRTPTAKRTDKFNPQCEIGMHLGFSRSKPGYAIEILEGPRKGQVVTSSQVVFNEDWFPKKDGMPDEKSRRAVDDAFANLAVIEWEDPPDFMPMTVDDSGDMTLEDDDDGDDDDEMPELVDDTDDEDDDDAGTVPAPRRSARLAGEQLPQTVFGYHHLDQLSKTSTHTAYSTCVDGEKGAAPRDTVPKHFSDIAKISDVEERNMWFKTHYHELDRLFANPDLLKAVPLPPGMSHKDLLTLRTIYKRKHDRTMKARCVLGGHRIPRGTFGRTFSPTIKPTTLRILLAMAPARLQISQGDVTQAYGQGIWPKGLKKSLSKMPEGYDKYGPDGTEYCCEVGNLYGHPIAGRNWYNTLVEKLLADGLTQSEHDPCLFYQFRGKEVLFVLVYVDDIVTLHSMGSSLRDEFAGKFGDEFVWTDYGTDLQEFLSMRIIQTSNTVSIDMERYITDLYHEIFGKGGSHASYAVPARQELPKMVREAAEKKDSTHSHDEVGERFRHIVAAILYAASMARPDVAYAIGMLSRCMAYPDVQLLHEAERVLIYLYEHRHLKLTYTVDCCSGPATFDWAPNRGPVTDGDADASFEIRRSTSGYMYFICCVAIAWCVRKQRSTALSSTEAELMAGSLAACEAVFIRELMREIGHPQLLPTVLRSDNSGAIDLAHDPVNHSKSKHILRKYFNIRELVADKTLSVKYVKSTENRADWLTKPLAKDAFRKARDASGLI